MEIIFLYFFYILQTIITRSVSNVRFDVRANYGAKYETVPLRPIERSFSILDDFKNSAYKLSCPGIQFAGIKFAGKIHISRIISDHYCKGSAPFPKFDKFQVFN